MGAIRSNVTSSLLGLAVAFLAGCASDSTNDTTGSTTPAAPASTTVTTSTATTTVTTTGPEPEIGPDPTMVGGSPAPTADPNAPAQVGPIDPGMTMSGDSVMTSLAIP